MVDQLPVEILIKIFANLELTDLLNVSRCCKKFFNVTNLSEFSDKILVNLNRKTDFQNFREVFGNTKRCYRKLSIDGLELNCDEHQLPSNLARNVTSLKLSSLKISNLTDFLKILMNCKNLEYISLEGLELANTTENPRMLTQISFQKLKRIEVLYSSNGFLEIFHDAGKSVDSIKLCLLFELEDRMKTHYYQIIKGLLVRSCQTLRKLCLHEVYFDDVFLNLISEINFPVLRKFAMSFNQYLPTINPRGLETFLQKNSRNIQKIKVHTFDQISNEKFQLLIDHLKNLRSLNLIVHANYNYDIKNFHHLNLLESLKIQPNFLQCNSRSYNSLITGHIISQKNLNLKKLTLISLDMNEEIVKNIIDMFPNLNYLNLSYSCKFKTEYFHILVANLRRLRNLVLTECNFTDNPDTILMDFDMCYSVSRKTF